MQAISKLEEKNIFAVDFISGGVSGLLTGLMIGPAEFAKIILQTSSRAGFTALKQQGLGRQMVKSLPTFSALVAGVSAFEFSVNDRIREKCGSIAGILASAFTGSLLLTPADHIMYRMKDGGAVVSSFKEITKTKWNGIFVGCIPMTLRESFHMLNVIYFGPVVGKYVQSILPSEGVSRTEDKLTSWLWNFAGRYSFGLFATFISQPFDVMARQMQVKFKESPNGKASFFTLLKELHQKHKVEYPKITAQFIRKYPLWAGTVPRLILAPVGSASIGGIFDFWKAYMLNEGVNY